MLAALVYVHEACLACGQDELPLQLWIEWVDLDEAGHAHNNDVDLIECPHCGRLDEGNCDLEALDALTYKVIDAFWKRRLFSIGEILAYRPETSGASKVVESLSGHYSSRLNQSVKYIVVHSTYSPEGSTPEGTRRYLMANERRVSVHELVLPGRKVYQMVTDPQAAHHCESESVRFPTFIKPVYANESTWGIEMFQIRENPVSDEVLEAAVDRVAEACQRLQISADCVLGHREIDPARRSDPVGVDMDYFRERVRRRLVGGTVRRGKECRMSWTS